MIFIRLPIIHFRFFLYSIAFGAIPFLQACSDTVNDAVEKSVSTYNVSITVTGLQEAITVTYDGGNDIPIETDGTLILATNLLKNSSYSVLISPPTIYQRCAAVVLSGTINQANVDISVTCRKIWYFSATEPDSGKELYKTDGTEQATQRVSDINPGAGSSKINYITEMPNSILFVANNGANGQELWTSDGKTTGTRILHEFSPGNATSDIRQIYKLNSLAFFAVASDNSNTKEIWVSDATSAGTNRVWNYAVTSNKYFVTVLAIIGNHIFFVVDDRANHTITVYRMDGTNLSMEEIASHVQGGFSPTAKLFFVPFGISQSHYFYMIRNHDTAPNSAVIWGVNETNAGPIQINNFTFRNLEESRSRGLLGDAGTKVLFAIDEANTIGLEPFSFDPSNEMVTNYADINPETVSFTHSLPEKIGNINGELVFSAYDGVSTKVWGTDIKSNGLIQLAEQSFANAPSAPTFFARTDNLLYFIAEGPAFTNHVWRTDGTATGTFALKPQGVLSGQINSFQFLGTIGTSILFSAFSDEHGQEIWLADGTATGTHIVKDIYPGTASSLSYLDARISNVDDVVYFAAQQGLAGRELWRSDGTTDGTYLVKDINQGTSRSSTPESLIALNNDVIFSADDGVNGKELWAYNASGSRLLKDIHKPSTESGLANNPELHSNINQLTAANSQAFFIANNSISGNELWRTDGITTYLVKDINPGNGAGSIDNITAFGNQVYFTANDRSATLNNNKIWISDGNESGTHSINGFLGSTPYGLATELTVVSSSLFFRSTIYKLSDLWIVDGAGVRIVKKINPNATYSPSNLYAFGNKLVFHANDGVSGIEPWVSDGTASGTVLIKDIANNPPILSSNPLGFGHINGFVYFSASETGNTAPQELWRTNAQPGTLNVTEAVIATGTLTGRISFPRNFTLVAQTTDQETLYFLARHINTGMELWKTNGTVTELVSDLYQGTQSSIIRDMVSAGGKLYFTAINGANGRELWTSDGTNTGTKIVKDILPGSTGSDPSSLTVVGELLYFAATDDRHGRELWESDGTKTGTVMVGDINTIGDGFGLDTSLP